MTKVTYMGIYEIIFMDLLVNVRVRGIVMTEWLFIEFS